MKGFLTILFLTFVGAIAAQNANQRTLSNNATLISNCDLDFLLSKHKENNEKTDEMEGYRIQIVYNSDRSAVYEKKSKVYQEFYEFKSYIVYDQPYYKLRIGDFETRLEARKYLEEVLNFFPTAFIVKDVIKIK